MSLWVVILGMGLLTFAIRLSFITFADYITLPPLVQRGLRFVPASILSAIILQDMLIKDGVLFLSPLNPRLWAGLFAIGVAWYTRNIIWALVAGMGLLWLLQYFGL